MSVRRRRSGAVAVLLTGVLTGCASVVGSPPPSAPVYGPPPTPTPAVTEPSSDDLAVAQQRAEEWLATTPMPEQAVRVEKSPSATFGQVWHGWVCTPTAEVKAYWTIAGLTPGETLNWMLEHPTPGLVLTRTQPVAADDSMDGALMGATPADSPLEGIAFTYASIDGGTAVRAQIGAVPAMASCPTPPGGGSWGRPGEG